MSGRMPEDIDRMISIKVDNISHRTDENRLREAFKKFGDVGDVFIPRVRGTMESRGFGFVRFYDQRDADDAIDEMDGRELDGRDLVMLVNFSHCTF
eukprot:m.91247 g.91247  ORF g.91247 m.91247 type:complete len:96 (-) comp13297_c0_seq3:348-635(-)